MHMGEGLGAWVGRCPYTSAVPYLGSLECLIWVLSWVSLEGPAAYGGNSPYLLGVCLLSRWNTLIEGSPSHSGRRKEGAPEQETPRWEEPR